MISKKQYCELVIEDFCRSEAINREELKEGFVFLYSDILFDESIVKGLLANHEDICLAIKKDNIRIFFLIDFS